MNTISQREARRLRRRVEQLEEGLRDFRRPFGIDYPGGVNIANEPNATVEAMTAIKTSRMLGHVVLACARDGKIALFAIPAPEAPI